MSSNTLTEPAAESVGQPKTRATLTRPTRNALLTAHIVVSVALLGDVVALMAVTIKAVTTGDPATAQASYEIMQMFSLVFGIPLSFLSLLTGVLLGRGTRWGVFRYPWVIGKLALILGVIAVGALLIGRAEETLLNADATEAARAQAERYVIIGGGFDIAALLTATGLSVFKPGRRRNRTVGAR